MIFFAMACLHLDETKSWKSLESSVQRNRSLKDQKTCLYPTIVNLQKVYHIGLTHLENNYHLKNKCDSKAEILLPFSIWLRESYKKKFITDKL